MEIKLRIPKIKNKNGEPVSLLREAIGVIGRNFIKGTCKYVRSKINGVLKRQQSS